LEKKKRGGKRKSTKTDPSRRVSSLLKKRGEDKTSHENVEKDKRDVEWGGESVPAKKKSFFRQIVKAANEVKVSGGGRKKTAGENADRNKGGNK